MPFERDYDPAELPVLAPRLQLPDQDGLPTPGFGELLGAAFRRENTIGSTITAAQESDGIDPLRPIDRSYDPFARLEERYLRHADAFVRANSDDEVARIKRRIDAEEADRRLLASGGGAGIAAAAIAGLVDPVNLIPVGGEIVAGTRLGVTVGRSALATARAGAIGATASEGVLQATQETRTAAESVEAIGAGTLLAGLLGAAAPAAYAAYGKARGLVRRGPRELAADAEAELAGELAPRPLGAPDPLVQPHGVRITADELQADLAAAERAALGDAVAEVRARPRGPADDPLVLIQPADIEATIVSRGGFRGIGDAEVKGAGWGMVKFIWKHGEASGKAAARQVSEADLLDFPRVIREYQARPVGDQREWVVDRGGRRIVYVDSVVAGRDGRRLITMYAADKAETKQLSPRISDLGKDAGPPGSPGRAFAGPSGDTAQPALRSPTGSQRGPADENIGPKGAENNRGYPPVRSGDGGSLSAAATASVVGERLKSALGVEKAINWSTPLLRLATSPSLKARQVLQQVAETPLAYDKNALGVASPVAAETLVKLNQWPLADAAVFLEKQWLQHRGVKGGKFRTEAADLLRRLPDGQLSWRQFKEEVGRAMRRGDQSEIPEAAAAARYMREKVFDPLKEAAIKEDLLPEDVAVDTALSYFSRVYDIERLKAKRPDFVRTVSDWLDGEQKTKAEIQRQVRELDVERDDLLRLFDRAEAKIGRREVRQADLGARADEAKRGQTTAVKRGFQLGARRDEIRLLLDDLANRDRLPEGLRAPDRKPKSLAEYVRQSGGLREDGGELVALGGASRPGLINNKAGKQIDDVALAAWEDGYFPDLGERPSVNQFLDALRADLSGQPRYAEADRDLAAAWRSYADLRAEVEKAGIDPRGMDDAQLAQALERVPAKAFAAELGLDLPDEAADELLAVARNRGVPVEDLVDDYVERQAIQWYENDRRAEIKEPSHAEPIPFDAATGDGFRAAQSADGAAQAGQAADGGAAARGGRGAGPFPGDAAAGPGSGDGAGKAGVTPAAERRRLDLNLRRQRLRAAEADFQGRRLGARVQALYDRLQGVENDLAALRGLRDDLGARLEDNANRLDALVERWPGKSDTPEAILRAETGLERAELDDLAEQIADHILRTPGGRAPYEPVPLVRRVGDPAARGPMKARAFNIPDQLIEPFLISDVEQVAHHYVRTMSPDVALKRALGSIDGREWLEEIRQDYRVLLRQAKTEKQRRQLERQSARDVNDAEALIQRLRGTYAAPADPDQIWVRVARGVRDWNYLRMMGMMTTSAIPDLGRPVMVYGLERVLGDGLKPLLANRKAFKLAAAEVKRAGAGLDMVLDSRAMNLADVGDDYGRQTKFERGLKAAADKFGVVALMAPWNAAMRQFAGVVAGQALIEDVQALARGKAARKAVERLAMGGIDEGRARAIAAQLREHGEPAGDLVLPHTERWTDAGAVEGFRAAIVKDVDRVIVTPGIGDRPLWMSTELGKLIGQFKSFSFASTQRVALSGLQQRDMAALNGVLLMTGLGMLTYGLQGPLVGREISDNPAVWLSEGIDRAGWTGWLYDVNNTLEKATRGKIGLHALMGGPPMTRYASRNLAGAILGPSIGTLADIGQVVGAVTNMDWQESDTRALRRMLPAQNLFYLRRLLDQAEHGINDTLGVTQ